MKYLLLFTLFITATPLKICFSQKIKGFYDDSIQVDNNNIPNSENQYYFPIQFFPAYNIDFVKDSTGNWNFVSTIKQGEFDTYKVKWVSKKLYALKEPLLFNKRIESEVYRFTWLRSFHNPISITIEKINKDFKLKWKVCNGTGGDEPGKLIIDKSKPISALDWDNFKHLVDSSDYWNTNGQPPRGPHKDGAEWILEGANPFGYQVIYETSPINGNLYNECIFLLKLTDLKISKTDIY